MTRCLMMVAGETSGDKHAALLIRSLKAAGDFRIVGIGGDRMKEAGMSLLHHVREMSVMGFSEVVMKLPFLRRVNSDIFRAVGEEKPAGIILVDYPGFNLRVAALARERGLKVIYFISPQIWAWGKRRIEKIRKTVDLMLTVFQFEEPMYRDAGVNAYWIGHPLVDELKQFEPDTIAKFRKDAGTGQDAKIIALLPGSRLQEIKRILPGMLRAARILGEGLRRRGIDTVAVIGCAPGIGRDVYEKIVAGSGVTALLSEQVELLMSSADAGMVASGTATLESALHDLPIVVVYRTGWLNFLIGRMLVKLDSISLVNIVARKRVVDEFVQGAFKPRDVAIAMEQILTVAGVSAEIKRQYAGVREALGNRGASDRAAELILKTI